MERFAKPGDFCPNEACPDYGKLQDGQAQQNLIKTSHANRGLQRYQCKTCGKTFTETTGTLFFGNAPLLKQRGHPDGPPPTISDGWGGIDEAMVEVTAWSQTTRGVADRLLERSPAPTGNICKWSSNAMSMVAFKARSCAPSLAAEPK